MVCPSLKIGLIAFCVTVYFMIVVECVQGDMMFRGLNIVFEVLNDLQVVHNTISLFFLVLSQIIHKKLQNSVFIFCLFVVLALTKA